MIPARIGGVRWPDLGRSIRRLFGRSPPAPPRALPPQPGYERDWQAGDVAECIGRQQWIDFPDDRPSTGPAFGSKLRVALIIHTDGTLWLGFAAFGAGVFPAGHFRKLRRCETEFTALVKRRAPVGPQTRERA